MIWLFFAGWLFGTIVTLAAVWFMLKVAIISMAKDGYLVIRGRTYIFREDFSVGGGP